MNTTRHGRGRAPRARAAAARGALALLVILAAGAAMAAKTIVTTSNMGFGRFVAGSGGSVRIGANGARSATGAVILLPSPAAPAAFIISGHDNKVTVLTLPSNGSVQLVSGANRMGLNNFASNLPAGGVLSPGPQVVTVGASLQVAPNQPRGHYNGAFHVIIEFQ